MTSGAFRKDLGAIQPRRVADFSCIPLDSPVPGHNPARLELQPLLLLLAREKTRPIFNAQEASENIYSITR